MLRVRLFDKKELEMGPSWVALGLLTSGIGGTLCCSSAMLSLIPTGFTQAVAALGFFIGYCCIIAGFSMSVIGLGIAGISAVSDALYPNNAGCSFAPGA